MSLLRPACVAAPTSRLGPPPTDNSVDVADVLDEDESLDNAEIPPARIAPRGLAGLLDGDTQAGELLDTSSLEPNVVLLNIYDISDDKIAQRINRVSTFNNNVLIGGIYHAGVEVFGNEWCFGFTDDDGTGIARLRPRGHTRHAYRCTTVMGATELSESEVKALLSRLSQEWKGEDYSLIHKNCLDFSNELCEELGVGRIPGWVSRYGRTAASLDILSRRAADGVQKTSTLVRSATKDISKDLGEGLSVAWTESAKVSQDVGANLSVWGQGFLCRADRWGRGLYRAASRALADEPAQASSRSATDQSLRKALQNRGGVTLVPKSVPAEATEKADQKGDAPNTESTQDTVQDAAPAESATPSAPQAEGATVASRHQEADADADADFE
eukprot:gnl/TRDRNA2_/TRDRNA2_84752_c0_seq2.p1 gnl/TRDRNA2_/TRDRNA2_84752_c0~~gnl/TRDRNA2_/TRDRNA2_84752_c0_seq2.p1  ORF type:complete len:386 (+),score=64.61 gnl/TRDRNA2_/TRDRNA2_84752_c0_seq2:60-1217(+)